MEAFASQRAKLSSLLQVRQISVIRVLSPFMSQHVSFKQKWTGRVSCVPCVCAILASHVLRMSAKTLPAKMLELWFFALCSYGPSPTPLLLAMQQWLYRSKIPAHVVPLAIAGRRMSSEVFCPASRTPTTPTSVFPCSHRHLPTPDA